MAEHREMNRLDLALEIWLRFLAGEEGDSEAGLLARHESLRDLLEPLLRGEDAADDAPDDADAEAATAAGTRPDDERIGGIRPVGASSLAKSVLGEFHLRREIGRGGMGVVFEAWQSSLDRRVAVKVLPPEVTRSPKTLARFRQEAAAAGRLEHEGVVDVFSVGEDNGVHYFAMEYVEGESLERRIASGGDFSREYLETAVGIVVQVADALHHAHVHGVIHRDVKPSNILVRRDGRAVLTDFGLARDQDLPSLTQTGEFAGTPYYMSPEQAEGRRGSIDARSDIFSLGVTLYELLTSRRPFDGETTQAILQGIIHRDPVEPQRINPMLAPDLVAVVLKAMEKRPTDRYPTAADLAADLRSFLAYRPVTARRLSRLRRLRRWVRREPLRAVLVGVLAVGVPTVTWLSISLLSSQETIEVGEETLRRNRVKDLLREAFLCIATARQSEAMRRFAEARELDPTSMEAVVGLSMGHLMSRRGQEVLGLLDANPEMTKASACLQRLRWIALDSLGRAPAGAERDLPEPATSLDFLALGIEEITRPGFIWETEAALRAYQHFGRAADLSPEKQPAVYYLRILTALNAGRVDELRDLVRCVEQFWPDAPHSHQWLAQALSASDPDRAVALYRKAIAHHPTDPFLFAALGRLMVPRDADEAERLFARAIELDPDRPMLRLSLAMLCLQKKEPARAERLCEECLGMSLQASDYRGVGAIYLRLGKPEKSIEVLDGGMAEFPNDVHLARALASANYMAGRQERYVEHLRQARDLEPDYAPTWQHLATALDKLGRVDEAIEARQGYLALVPDDVESFHRQALACYRRGRFTDALRAAGRALSQDGQHLPSRSVMALSLLALRRAAEARPHLHQVLAGDREGYLDTYLQEARRMLGERGGSRAAIVLLQAVVEDGPADSEAHRALVDALTRDEDLGGLRAELHRWTDIRSDTADAWRELAEHLLRPDLPAQWRAEQMALFAAHKSVELTGRRDPMSLVLLAEAQHAGGEAAAAKATAREALTAVPADATAELREAVARRAGRLK